jgi:hypothetical protein
MTLVLVTKEALAELIAEAYELMEALAVEGGALRPSQGERIELSPEDPVVIVAVEAGIQLPGPMVPGMVPPVPPTHLFDINKVTELMEQCVEILEQQASHELNEYDGSDGVHHATTYRRFNDQRLRCTEDGKVVYTSMEQAERAAKKISEREPMTCYRGRCGHYHVSRKKGSRR